MALSCRTLVYAVDAEVRIGLGLRRVPSLTSRFRLMTSFTRRRRSRRRFYWPELGFLILGIIGLKPEIITALLPSSRNPSMVRVVDGTPVTWVANPNNGTGNPWNLGTDPSIRTNYSSYYPSLTVASNYPTNQTASQSWYSTPDLSQGTLSNNFGTGHPPVVWPDKYAPNSVMHSNGSYLAAQPTLSTSPGIAYSPNPSSYAGQTGFAGQTGYMAQYPSNYTGSPTTNALQSPSGYSYANNNYPSNGIALQPMHAVPNPTSASAAANLSPRPQSSPYYVASAYPSASPPGNYPSAVSSAPTYPTSTYSTYPSNAYPASTYPASTYPTSTNSTASPYVRYPTVPASVPSTAAPINTNSWQQYGVPPTTSSNIGRY
jgi:hypothetical protein